MFVTVYVEGRAPICVEFGGRSSVPVRELADKLQFDCYFVSGGFLVDHDELIKGKIYILSI